jgi:Zn-dependent protease with chaperone function
MDRRNLSGGYELDIRRGKRSEPRGLALSRRGFEEGRAQMLPEQEAQAIKNYMAAQIPNRPKARFRGKTQWFIVLVLFIAVGVLYVALNPWAFFLGGHFHPFGFWQGWGRMHSTTAGDYFLYVYIYPNMHTKGMIVPGDAVKGNARLCTPKGETYYLNLGGGMPFGYYVNSLGKPIHIYMYKYRTFSPDDRPSLDLFGKWGSGELIADDHKTLAKAFLPNGTLRPEGRRNSGDAARRQFLRMESGLLSSALKLPNSMATDAARPLAIGPRDRESFFEAQRRNRRATWRLSVVSVLATVVMGIPLALTVTPLLYAAALVIADVINIGVPLPPSFWQHANDLACYGMLAIGWLTHGETANPQALALGAAVLLLPGAILSLALWIGVNALFRRAGVGGALLALKAREPNQSELKELQLSDVVQEMAIAAGLPAPCVMLIDTSAANAAAIGTSAKDARIVVTHGLLETLRRDELEGALAHLVGSIGNGDLGIAFRVTSVFETCGLLLALINSPFGPRARRTLWRVVRYSLSARKSSENDAAEAGALADLLTRGAGLETDDIDNFFGATSRKKSALRSIRNFLFFPIFFTNVAIKLSLWFFSFSMLEPSMALLWRKRKYLADASAVQLTRNPDGLAEALRKLNSEPRVIPGGSWAPHLFLVNPSGSDRINDPKANAANQKMLADMWAASAPGATPNKPSAAGSSASAGLSFITSEIIATNQSAIAGHPAAAARMAAFRQAAATALGRPVDDLPDLSDLAAAQHGDKAAMQRLADFGKKINPNESDGGDAAQATSDSSNFAGFFPSLKRRLKRLDRMGAHVAFESNRTGPAAVIFIALLSLFLGPFALLVLALLVLLIGILMFASLGFLAVWMAFIHQLFVMFVHH